MKLKKILWKMFTFGGLKSEGMAKRFRRAEISGNIAAWIAIILWTVSWFISGHLHGIAGLLFLYAIGTLFYVGVVKKAIRECKSLVENDLAGWYVITHINDTEETCVYLTKDEADMLEAQRKLLEMGYTLNRETKTYNIIRTTNVTINKE